jgi:lipoate-protein ligase A
LTVNEDLLTRYETDGRPAHRVYEPEQTVVVMGPGRRGKGDVREEAVETDGVPVLLRRGGGGTVVLSRGMVVLALVATVRSAYRNLEYARLINGWFRDALAGLGVTGVDHRGVSDLAIGERKILGTSIFRRRLVLFYQASLLVENDISLFSRYLTYPSLVPEYRNGRAHEDFCTSLRLAGHAISTSQVMTALEPVVAARLRHLEDLDLQVLRVDKGPGAP